MNEPTEARRGTESSADQRGEEEGSTAGPRVQAGAEQAWVTRLAIGLDERVREDRDAARRKMGGRGRKVKRKGMQDEGM